MRTVKEAEERRNEILDVAEELFGLYGFDKTSTNDILNKVGIARGTLYYHFKSKEDIMDALIARQNNRLIRAAREVADDKSIPVYERVLRVVMAMNLREGSEQEMLEHIHKPQNALMHQKIQCLILEGVTPILADVIQDGVDQGLFDSPYPYECMELVIAYANSVFDNELVVMSDEDRIKRIQALIFHIERMLGAKPGCFLYGMDIFGGNIEK